MRLGIVNDSPLAAECLRRIVDSAPEHEAAWIARDGLEAVRLCAEDTPDLILMDLVMPVLNGVEATRRIMTRSPCAILVVTATVEGNAAMVFEAMGAGALDVVRTPMLGGSGGTTGSGDLLRKIGNIGKIVVDAGKRIEKNSPAVGTGTWAAMPDLLVIGASTGGPQALARILASLPADFPAGILIIQHVDAQFVNGLTEWLDGQTALRVMAAKPGHRPRSGVALIAETNGHLLIDAHSRIQYVQEPRDIPYRPSVDVAFESLSRSWPAPGAAVILTGMGRDGARGLLALKSRGWYTVAQDKATSAVYGMPKAAVDIGAATNILALEDIGLALADHFTQMRRNGPVRGKRCPT